MDVIHQNDNGTAMWSQIIYSGILNVMIKLAGEDRQPALGFLTARPHFDTKVY